MYQEEVRSRISNCRGFAASDQNLVHATLDDSTSARGHHHQRQNGECSVPR